MECVNVCLYEGWGRAMAMLGYWEEAVTPSTAFGLWMPPAWAPVGRLCCPGIWLMAFASGPPLVNKRPRFVCDDILAPIERVKGEGLFFQR